MWPIRAPYRHPDYGIRMWSGMIRLQIIPSRLFQIRGQGIQFEAGNVYFFRTDRNTNNPVSPITIRVKLAASGTGVPASLTTNSGR